MMTEQMINHDKDEFAELLLPDYRKIIFFFFSLSLSLHACYRVTVMIVESSI